MPRQQLTGAHPTDKTREQEVLADPYVRALNVIDATHEMMHQGRYFTVSGEVSVDSNASASFLLNAPGNSVPHLRLIGLDASAAPVKLFVFEAPTVAANGTPLAAVNNNRLSTRVAGLQVFRSPTITANGDQLFYKQVPGAKQSGGSGESYFIEWILAPGKQYLVRADNVSGGSAVIGYTFEWYEP